jgi:hypothetical protein
MEKYAVATYEIVKLGVVVEAILDIESSAGWLGCCIISSKNIDEIRSLCLAEAERRAAAVGLKLDRLSEKSSSFRNM